VTPTELKWTRIHSKAFLTMEQIQAGIGVMYQLRNCGRKVGFLYRWHKCDIFSYGCPKCCVATSPINVGTKDNMKNFAPSFD
jgi:hypothetical protein